MLVIGSRGSQLALWQAHWVKERLEDLGEECRIEIIHTTGDKITDVALSKVGTKGLFTKEIEEALLAEYDMAHGTQEQAAPLREEFRIPSPPKWMVGLAVLGILVAMAGVIAGGAYGWRRYAAHRAAKRLAISAMPSRPPEDPALRGDRDSRAVTSSPGASGSLVSGASTST